jgi:hypothetical protein
MGSTAPISQQLLLDYFLAVDGLVWMENRGIMTMVKFGKIPIFAQFHHGRFYGINQSVFIRTFVYGWH